MKTQEERLFRIPVEELRALLKRQHGVELSTVEPYIDGEFVVFAVQVPAEVELDGSGAKPIVAETALVIRPRLTRRTRRKRNRVKTRGWEVVGKITNAQGLVANVYRPFVDALRDRPIARSEQRKIVRQIMVQNGNRPTEASVDYYLDNTLQFLSGPPGAQKTEVTV